MWEKKVLELLEEVEREMEKREGNEKKGMVAVKSAIVRFYDNLRKIEKSVREGKVQKVKVVEDNNYIRILVGGKEHRLKKRSAYIERKREILEEFLRQVGAKVEKKVLEPLTIGKYEGGKATS